MTHYSIQESKDDDTGAPIFLVWSGPIKGLPLTLEAITDTHAAAKLMIARLKKEKRTRAWFVIRTIEEAR